MNTTSVIKISLIAIIIILFGITTKLNKNLRELEAEKTKNNSTIASYELKEEDREALNVQKETIVLTAEQKAESSEKSVELGNKVCEYQNAYFTMDTSTDRTAFDENVKNLKACFNISDNGSAAVPWYPRSAMMTGTWTYITNDEDGGQDGLWLCRNEETGVLLAYAMANYNYETGLFDALTFSATFAGNAAMSATDSPEATTVDPIVDEVNQMAEEMTTEVQYDETGEPIVTTEATTQSSEEVQKQSDARASNIEAREKIMEQTEAGE